MEPFNFVYWEHAHSWSSQVVLVVKNLPANAGDIKAAALIPESGRSFGGGHDNPLQYSCLSNPMDREVWWTTVHGVTKSQTQLKQLSTHAHVHFSLTFKDSFAGYTILG